MVSDVRAVTDACLSIFVETTPALQISTAHLKLLLAGPEKSIQGFTYSGGVPMATLGVGGTWSLP